MGGEWGGGGGVVMKDGQRSSLLKLAAADGGLYGRSIRVK